MTIEYNEQDQRCRHKSDRVTEEGSEVEESSKVRRWTLADRREGAI